jgi:hypothetical protein
MKNFFLIVILLTVLIGSFCILSFQIANKVAVKVDRTTDNKFAVKESINIVSEKVDGLYNKAKEIVAEGYSEPDEERKVRKERP